MAIDDQSEPQFLIFQETLPWQPTFFFRNFVFFRHSSKTKRDTHTVQGKENVGNLVFGRMAPSVMTSGDPESQNCFWFYYFFGSNLLNKYATDLRRFSPAGRPTGVDDCCKIGLLSRKGRCHGNEFSSFSDIFRPIRTLFCSGQSPFVRFIVWWCKCFQPGVRGELPRGPRATPKTGPPSHFN